MNTKATPTAPPAANLVSFDRWLADRGSTRTTGWRYRQAGLIQTVNIFGRLYVSRQEIARFEQRAMAGEFARMALTPGRKPTATV